MGTTATCTAGISRIGASERPRTCQLLDPENLVGGPERSAEEVRRWFDVYRSQAVGVLPGDMVIAGVSHFAAKTFCFALTGENIQWRLGSGPDGAETALLDSIDLRHIARRYDRLVIGSGDYRFAAVAQQATALGMRVHLVSGRGWVSHELRAACPTRTRIREVHRYLRPRALPDFARLVGVAA